MTSPQLPVVAMLAALALAGAILVVVLAFQRSVPASVRACAMVAFVGHLVVGGLLYSAGWAADSDAATYHATAVKLMEHWQGNDAMPRLVDGKLGWTYLLAGLYYVATPALSYGVVVNAAAMGLLPLLVYWATAGFGRPDVGRVAALLSILVPGYWVWGALPLREAIVLLALAGSALATSRLLTGSARARWFFTLAAFLLLLLAFRGSMALLVAVSLAVGMAAVALGRRAEGRLGKYGLLVILLMVVVGQVALVGASSQLNVERITAVRSAQATDTTTAIGSAALGGPQVTDGFGGLAQLSLSVLPNVALGPFPWELSGNASILLVDTFFWWVILGLTISGLRSPDGRRLARIYLPTVLGLFVALALYSGNYGTMVRLRSQAYPFIIPIAAVALAGARPKRALDDEAAGRATPELEGLPR